MRSRKRFSRAFGFHTALVALAVAAVPSAVASDLSYVSYADVFCGNPPATWRKPEPLVLPPHELPVTVEVSIYKGTFTPPDVTIQVGDTVRWTNNDLTAHTTTSDTAVWDSGALSLGQSFSFTFTGTGDFPYHCNIHPVMTATIRVLSGATPTPSPTSTPCSPAGSLDTSFDGDGKVITPIGTEFEVARSVAIQSDGRIVAIGNSYNGQNSDFAVVRYNTDGTLDTSFDGDGKVVTPIFASSDDNPYSVAIQPDGRLVVAGSTFNGTTADFAVVRYNTNGTLDTSFDGDGKAITPIGSSADVAHSVAMQADGRIVVAGSSVSGSALDFAVVRYNTNGTLDTSFDGDGKLITSIDSSDDGATSVKIQTDGRIVAAGYSFTGGLDPDFAVVRYNSNGTLDTSFDGDGMAVTSVGAGADFALSVALQADGRIVAAGCTGCTDKAAPEDDFAVVRYNTNGTLDTSFDGDGKAITPVGSLNDGANSVAVQTDGRIVAAGFSYNGTNENFAIVRYNANGTLDTSFDGDGKAVTPFTGSSYDRANSVAIQTDGRIVAAGSTSVAGPSDFAVVRYNGGPCSPTSATSFDFDGDHKADLSVFRPSVGEWYYHQSGNGFVTGFGFGSSTDRPVPADFTGDGKTDIAFFMPSTADWYVLRSEDSTYYAFPFGASGDIPAPADFDGDGQADPTVYRPSAQTWFILKSTGGVSSVPFGLPNDVPVPADYDGDGLADVGIYRPDVGQWWNLRSSNGSVFAANFGSSTDKPVAGDYTGDGAADVAFFRPSEATWYVLRSEDQSFFAFPFGSATDKPAPADFDGDGKFDAAIFRPSDTNWYILKSTGGVVIQQFGLPNDVPLPGAFVP